MGTARLRVPLGLLAILALSLFIAGCGSVFGGGQQGGGGDGGNGGSENNETVRLNLGGDVPDLNPTTSTDVVSSDITDNVMEGLYRLNVNEDMKPEPAMAESVETSDDEKTYTFTLRDGIQWSNGDPVTSADFKYAWLRSMNPDTAGQYAFILTDYIKGGAEYASGDGSAEDVAISTPDEKTLEVTLVNPTPYFLDLTSFTTYFPLNQDFVEEQGDQFAKGADSMLYNGPYTMTEFNSAQGAKLKKNPDYWDADNVDIENVEYSIVKDEQTALNLYQDGQLDRTGLTSDQVDRFRDDPEFTTETLFVTWWLVPNFEDEVTGNENIRKAIQTGIDKEALADTILNNGSEPAGGLVPPRMAGPDDQTYRDAYEEPAPEFDPQQAKQYYQQAVDELGNEPTIELLIDDSSTARDYGTFVQGQLKENLGANVKLKALPFDARLDAQQNGDFQLSLYGWAADYNDPSTFLDLYLSESAFNDPGFSNDRYDELMQGVKTETDPQQRMEMMAEAERILIEEEAAISPQYYEGTAGLVKPYLTSAPIPPFRVDYPLKYWEMESQQ